MSLRSPVPPAILVAMCLLAGCARTASELPVAPAPAGPLAPVTAPVPTPEIPGEGAPSAPAELVAGPGDTTTGTGRMVGTPSARRAPAAPAIGPTTLNFRSAPIQDVVKAVLGDVLHVNFVIDPQVTGTVTIESPQPLPRDALLPTLEQLLAINGAVLLREGDLYRVVPRAAAAKAADLVPGGTPSGAYSARIVQLRYVAAAEIRKILEPFLPDPAALSVDPKRNILIVSGTTAEIDRIVGSIEIFDVDWMQGMSTALVALESVDARTMLKELAAALDGTDNALLGGLVRAVTIDRLNALLLVSPQSSAIATVREWIARLDRSDQHGGERLYVYKVQNKRAVELAQILNQLYQSPGTAQAGMPPVSVAPGTVPATLTSTPMLPGTMAAPVAATSLSAAAIGGVAGEQRDVPVRIIADDGLNALLIQTTPQVYKVLSAAIRQLDVVPLQVLIEARIVEVTLNDTLAYGVEWFFKNGIDEKKGIGLLDLGAPGLTAFAPAFSYAVIDTADRVRLVLNALAAESSLNVLSSPSLMVLDNRTATINVGDEIPIPTRQATSNIDPDAPTVNEITYRNTGVILTVTPRVNSGGLVTMQIRQEVSDAVATTSSALDAPTIQQRSIESEVAVMSGSTVMLGGLIRNANSEIDEGLPFLKRIPVLGKAFGRETNTERRTELLVLITPRAVEDDRQAGEATEEFRRKLHNLAPP